MLDIRRIRAEPDAVRSALARRGDPSVVADIDVALELDERHRALVAERDEARARIKAISKEVGQLHKQQRGDEAEARQAESRALGERERELDATCDAVAE